MQQSLPEPSSPEKKRSLCIIGPKENPPSHHVGPTIRISQFGSDLEAGVYHFFNRSPGVDCLYHVSFTEETVQYANRIKHVLHEIHLGFGGYEDSFIGVKNVIKNSEYFLKHNDICRARTTFKSAVIVAAGPSLNKHWKWLKEQKDILILACDVTYKKCLKEGVIPHIVCTTERVELTAQALSAIPNLGTLLVPGILAYPKTIEQWEGPINFVSRQSYLSEWLPFPKRKEIQSFPSVVPHLLGICGLLKVKNIMMLGQDLCFSGENSHADLAMPGVQKEMEDFEKTQKGPEIKCYDGALRPTTPVWLAFRQEIPRIVNRWALNVYSGNNEGAIMDEVSFCEPKDWEHERGGEFVFSNENPLQEEETDAWFKKIEVTKKEVLRIARNFKSYKELTNITNNLHIRSWIGPALVRDRVMWKNNLFIGVDTTENYRVRVAHAMRDLIELLP